MEAEAYPIEVIDLLSTSSEDEEGTDVPVVRPATCQIGPDGDGEDEDGGARLPTAGASPPNTVDTAPQDQPPQQLQADGGMIVVIDGEEVFIPDEEAQAGPGADPFLDPKDLHTNGDEAATARDREFTVDDCLQAVLEIFPDISHDHVRNLFTLFDAEGDDEYLAGRARLDKIVEQLVSDPSYPKQEKGKLKRKREDSVDGAMDMKRWERSDRAAVPNWARGSILAICKAEFPSIPKNHITDRFSAHQHLFQTYVALAKDIDDSEEGNRIFGRGRATKNACANADTIALNCGHPNLVDELAAARVRVAAVRAQYEAARTKKRAEEENLRKAIAAGETTECSACFDDLPMNRQIHCNGSTAHFTCFECAEAYIKTEVGDARCEVLCTAGCGAGFAYNQLNLLENKQLLEKLAQIQQEQDIRNAGLDDLEECPFCDFKAIMPPIEEDFEFRCANPECERVSCRRCKAISHIPISCEQHAKDNRLSSRHQIEEAMTAALIRSCNKCKKVFIKESGCNKMHCMSCGTLQCYVCSAIIRDYNHFDQRSARSRTAGGLKKCPLYDNVEERHEREVSEAEAKARAEIVEQNPDVNAEDLEIKVSDAVKKAEADKIKRASGGHGGYAGRFGIFPGQGMLNRGFGLARGGGQFWGDDDGGDGDNDDFDDVLGMLAPRGVRRRPRARNMRAAGARPNLDQLQAGFDQGWHLGREINEALEQVQEQGGTVAPEQNAFYGQPFAAQGPNQGLDRTAPAAPPPHGYRPFYFDDGQQAPQIAQAEPQAAVRDHWAPIGNVIPELQAAGLRAHAVMRNFEQPTHAPLPQLRAVPGHFLPHVANAASSQNPIGAALADQEPAILPRPANPYALAYPHVHGAFPQVYQPFGPYAPAEEPQQQQQLAPPPPPQQQQERYQHVQQQEPGVVRMQHAQIQWLREERERREQGQRRMRAERVRERAVDVERERLWQGEREQRPY